MTVGQKSYKLANKLARIVVYQTLSMEPLAAKHLVRVVLHYLSRVSADIARSVIQSTVTLMSEPPRVTGLTFLLHLGPDPLSERDFVLLPGQIPLDLNTD
ncbi:hypothetical protein J6590_013668 [Homalodisca vitripennis]|nr:hypothetical protein J6590_013668 [Homalodisca vitripennis]